MPGALVASRKKNGLRVKALLGNYYFTSVSLAEFANKSLSPNEIPRALVLEKGALREASKEKTSCFLL